MAGPMTRLTMLLALALAFLMPLVASAVDIPFFGVHRGGAAWRPEHTIETYRAVVAQWPHAMLECDARLTKDGVVVLHHDTTVDRTTDGEGPIAELTLEQVKALDAGYDFTPDGGASFPYRGKGLTIATLEEYLTAFPNSPILIELKDQPGIVPALIEVITRHHAEDRVLIASFQPATMDQIKQALPGVKTCFSMVTGMRLMAALRGDAWDAYLPEDDVLALGIGMLAQYGLTAEDIAKIRAKGVAVQLFDVDTEETMRQAIALGVDGVLTDRPDLLAQVLAEQPEPR